MSVSLWAYSESCEGQPCCGDCDLCSKADGGEDGMEFNVDVAAKPNCYAVRWSYGEICCGCGCCSPDPVTQLKARIEYHEDAVRECENFKYWFDDEEMKAIQKKRIAAEIRHHKKMVEKYRTRLEALGKGEKDGDTQD